MLVICPRCDHEMSELLLNRYECCSGCGFSPEDGDYSWDQFLDKWEVKWENE